MALHEQLVGRTIAGKFVVEDLIGSGAMGAVFRARQVALEKTVAIKVLHGEHASDPQFVARFHREAKAASRLNHPNSMQVLDFGEEPDGLLYIAMEYLDGRSLHRLLREEGRLPPARVADILMQALAALAVAHDMGVVHRDLKPENVVVLRGADDDGRPRDIVKVCDFGIAKITDPRAYGSGEHPSDAPVTTAGLLVGTPEYMSPEQGRGEKLDARSDLYSVGVILFEMITGRLPFEAENAIGIVLRHVTEPPPIPSRVAADVDPRLEAICLRALQKMREHRYQSAREMRSDLRAAAAAAEVPSSPRGAVVRVVTDTPASEAAPTLELAVPAMTASGAEAVSSKPTFAGTTASAIPGVPRTRKWLLAGAGAAATGALGLVLLLAGNPRPAPQAATVSPPSARAPAETTLAPEPLASADDVPPLDEGVARANAGPGRFAFVVRTGSATHVGSASGKAAAGAVAREPHAAPSGEASAAPAASAAALPATAPTVAPSVEPVAPPAPAPPPAVVDPSFDPQRAYVEVGLINAQGMPQRAIRAALHGIPLAQCYRAALTRAGSRLVGVATLDLSIDETGVTRSAVVTDAEFLPGLTRCLQGMTSALRVPSSEMESGGGTAEVTLAFRAP